MKAERLLWLAIAALLGVMVVDVSLRLDGVLAGVNRAANDLPDSQLAVFFRRLIREYDR